jgi:hypothetical protein
MINLKNILSIAVSSFLISSLNAATSNIKDIRIDKKQTQIKRDLRFVTPAEIKGESVEFR